MLSFRGPAHQGKHANFPKVKADPGNTDQDDTDREDPNWDPPTEASSDDEGHFEEPSEREDTEEVHSETEDGDMSYRSRGSSEEDEPWNEAESSGKKAEEAAQQAAKAEATPPTPQQQAATSKPQTAKAAGQVRQAADNKTKATTKTEDKAGMEQAANPQSLGATLSQWDQFILFTQWTIAHISETPGIFRLEQGT